MIAQEPSRVSIIIKKHLHKKHALIFGSSTIIVEKLIISIVIDCLFDIVTANVLLFMRIHII